ncbi:MAG: DUF167 domain-containing protein [Candidatus Hodarchaeales archaeon]|jgi:uncharacterized protein (TIGR00251 family)
MSVIEDSEKGCLIHVHVHPGSPKQKIRVNKDPLEIQVRLKQQPKQGKANKELIRLFGKLFRGHSVMLVAGAKSSFKILEIQGINSQHALNKLLLISD